MLEKLRKELSKIKQKGYIPSIRKGPTGIGHTLEKLLGVKENNLYTSDFNGLELKARRENFKGMLTLFTFNKKAWKVPPLDAILQYGSKDKDGRQGLYYTMKMKPNSAGLFLHVDRDTVEVRHINGKVILSWSLSEIKKRFSIKVKNVLLVSAKVEERGGIEHFCYDGARLLSGGTSVSILKKQFELEHLIIDLRLHDKGGSARNHGTGFRVYENYLEQLYGEIKEIEF